ncbi:MAG: rod shape-determining protein RodA [Steroidobacteraceae bacterium]
MIRVNPGSESTTRRTLGGAARVLSALQLDGPLLIGVGLVSLYGLIVLYSASGQSWDMVLRACARLAIGSVAMVVLAQVRPQQLRQAALPLWIFGVVLLIVVDVMGVIGKGAQRWLDLGFIRFQPSELMKLAVPMTCAWYLHERPLPPTVPMFGVLALIILFPAALTAAQPDLGTAILITIAGGLLVIMAGLSVWFMAGAAAVAAVGAWVGWKWLLHDYQRQRVLTFIDPQTDPLGAGYHIIQSQIAIGSGGLFGKGWMNGSQSQLEYLPERHTDFIFAVIGEEFGLLGLGILLMLYVFVVARALYLASQTQDTFARLLAACLALTFFVYVFINTGMVSGILPVVGVPLPLVSYGGTSIVTLLASFGILMALYSHRKLVGT